ncbi:class I SAM-dependent methyltransferase [Virgibacillus sp. W0181]|uniref:class I SAM-dependent methyltransferase n=1 Tax=Virgibacillus sp. W0181 TaxID=3391581 RepID=UPI003F44DE08
MERKEKVQAMFSKNKQGYITSSTHSKVDDFLTEWLQPHQSMIALDVATGGGHVAKMLSNKVDAVFATDITEAMLENTRNHLKDIKNIHYLIADAEQLPFLDETFDIVTCRIAAHHFPNPELFIYDVQRVLKKNGTFLFIDNVSPNDYYLAQYINTLEKMRDHSHVESRSITTWKKYFQTAHFDITKEHLRKKVLPFDEWVRRTLDDQATIDQVKMHLLNAPSYIKSYFQLKTNNTKIDSFAIDEWICLVKKKNKTSQRF